MEPCLTISFSCDYKDRWKDTMRKKLSFFLSGLLTSLALFALGVYLSIAETTVSIGTPLMLIGVLGILISPFAALFQKSGNKGFTGNLRILFYKNGDSQIYDYHLLGTRKEEAFESKEQVFQIKMKKYMAILISPQGESYYIPLRQLDAKQIEKLKQISKDVYQFRGKPVKVETISLDNDKGPQDVFDEEQKE